MFSITEQESLHNAFELREQILRVKNDDRIPFLLVGNKSDLASERREVSLEEASEVARSWQVPYVETSAKTRHNVDAVFFELLREIKRRRDIQRMTMNASKKTKSRRKRKLCRMFC